MARRRFAALRLFLFVSVVAGMLFPAPAVGSDLPAPTNLTATLHAGAPHASVDLTWDGTPACDGCPFNVQWSTSADFGGASQTDAPGSPFNVGELAPGTTYYFRVRVHRDHDPSDWSPAASVTTVAAPDDTLPAPTELTATRSASHPQSAVVLTWNGSPACEACPFNVQWSTSPDLAGASQTDAPGSGFTVGGLQPQTRYFFRVRAHRDHDPSEWSNVAEATTTAARVTRTLATPVVRQDGAGNLWVTLRWDRVPGATEYEVEGPQGSVTTTALHATMLTLRNDAPTPFEVRATAHEGASLSEPGSVEAVSSHTPVYEQISLTSDGRQFDEPARDVAVSGDGITVAFVTAAALTLDDRNGRDDVYVSRATTGRRVLERVSRPCAGGRDLGGSSPSLSHDGRTAAFVAARQLCGTVELVGEDERYTDVYRATRDRRGSWTTELLSRPRFEGSTRRPAHSREPVVAPDGRRITFTSSADDLIPGDVNHGSDVFTWELGRTRLRILSVGGLGWQGRGDLAAASGDGRYVAYTGSHNLVPGRAGSGNPKFAVVARDGDPAPPTFTTATVQYAVWESGSTIYNDLSILGFVGSTSQVLYYVQTGPPTSYFGFPERGLVIRDLTTGTDRVLQAHRSSPADLRYLSPDGTVAARCNGSRWNSGHQRWQGGEVAVTDLLDQTGAVQPDVGATLGMSTHSRHGCAEVALSYRGEVVAFTTSRPESPHDDDGVTDVYLVRPGLRTHISAVGPSGALHASRPVEAAHMEPSPGELSEWHAAAQAAMEEVEPYLEEVSRFAADLDTAEARVAELRRVINDDSYPWDAEGLARANALLDTQEQALSQASAGITSAKSKYGQVAAIIEAVGGAATLDASCNTAGGFHLRAQPCVRAMYLMAAPATESFVATVLGPGDRYGCLSAHAIANYARSASVGVARGFVAGVHVAEPVRGWAADVAVLNPSTLGSIWSQWPCQEEWSVIEQRLKSAARDAAVTWLESQLADLTG